MMQLLNKIAKYAEQQGSQIALDFDGKQLTYAQLQAEINRARQPISKLESNNIVALTMQQPLLLIVNYLAVLSEGNIPCVCDFRWTNKQRKEILAHYQIPYVMDDKLTVITTGYSQQDTYDNTELQLLHIGFTSGTTGLPKAYYRDEPSWINSYVENEKLLTTTISTILAPGPLSHSLSLYACIYALYSGRTFIGQQTFSAALFIDQITAVQQQVALFLVPTMLIACLTGHQQLNGQHFIFSSGDKLAPHIREKVSLMFPKAIVVEFFGTSEASFISYNYNNQAPTNSVGKLFDNVFVRFDNQDHNQIGTLNINSNMVFSGYVDQGFRQDEWIRTGDFASMDDAGYLYLHGREHDRLIIGGRNVYPSEVEEAIKGTGWFDEVLVIGQAHPKFGEIAILLYKAPTSIDYIDLKCYLSQQIPRYQIPSKLIRVEQFEYTVSGKIARHKMKQWYRESGDKG